MHQEQLDETALQDLPEAAEIIKVGAKLTAITLGGGMMGCDSRQLLVSKGFATTSRGPALLYSHPRGRKKFFFSQILGADSIILRGHLARKDGVKKVLEADTDSMILDGVGGRFIADDDGPRAMLEHLKERMILHTIPRGRELTCLKDGAVGADHREDAIPPGEFHDLLFEILGEPADLDVRVRSQEPKPHKGLFTSRMKRQLKARQGSEPTYPLFKLFNPEGYGTWLVYGMEEDGDTLWVVADIGFGCVEYGTQSLAELESIKGATLGLGIERDLHFDGRELKLEDLLKQESLRV